jgi:hypothetical protein
MYNKKYNWRIIMEIKILEIKPNVAKQMLEMNDGNRKISRSVTSKYAEDMRRNKWDLNGETIKLCNTGEERNPPLWVHKLIDGQHRLSACVKAKKSFLTAVAFVDSPKSFSTIDCGRSRTSGDICKILGYKNSSALAATLKLQVKVEQNKLVDSLVGSGTTAHVKNYEIEKELNLRPDIIRSVEFAGRFKAKLKTRPACMGVAHYNMCKIDKELGEECLTLFHTGEGLKAGNPILAYRNYLISWMQNENNKLTNHYLLKGLYNMWNGWIDGKSITRCRVMKTGPLPRLKRP